MNLESPRICKEDALAPSWYYPVICRGRKRETTENLNQVNQYPGLDWNPVSPQYVSKSVVDTPPRSV